MRLKNNPTQVSEDQNRKPCQNYKKFSEFIIIIFQNIISLLTYLHPEPSLNLQFMRKPINLNSNLVLRDLEIS